MTTKDISKINIPSGDVCRLKDYRLTFGSGTSKFLREDGNWATVSTEDTNTTYTLSKSGHTITLTGSDSSTKSVTVNELTATVTGTNLTLA